MRSTLFSLSANLAVILSDAFSERVYIEVPLVVFFFKLSTCKDIKRSLLFSFAISLLFLKDINTSFFLVKNTLKFFFLTFF